MASTAYGTPLILAEGKPLVVMSRVSLAAKGEGAIYDEAFIQQLAFDHPSCLPINEIDVAYQQLVPVCMELPTPAGPMDALYVTPTGRLIVLEAKLWRNPEARRKVVAQILDYAKELSNWSYEDLQREISRRLGRKGNVLYELVCAAYPDTDEISFVDGVQQSLERGRFLLLIVGDGIKEGAGAIAEFLESVGSLEFTFGLVELALYRHDDQGLLIQPRVIARTVEFQRSIVVLPEGARLESAAEFDTAASREDDELKAFYQDFWKEFLDQLQLDDVSQQMANVSKTQNIYFSLPPSGGAAWISAYFAKSRETVGVYFRTSKAEIGRSLCEQLGMEREEIAAELSNQQEWTEHEDGRFSVAVKRRLDDVHAKTNREEIKNFFAEQINAFINSFRPRLKRISQDVE